MSPLGTPETAKAVDTRLGQLSLKQRILQLHKSAMSDNGVLPPCYKGFSVDMSDPDGLSDHLEILTLNNTDRSIIKDKYFDRAELQQKHTRLITKMMSMKSEEQMQTILGKEEMPNLGKNKKEKV